MKGYSKERPIPFNDAMVRAILERRKTMTRRVVKPQPEGEDLRICQQAYDWTYSMEGGIWGLTAGDQHCEKLSFKCPYGKPGDRLWVKETWAKVPETAYWHDQTIPHKVHREEDGYGWWAVYRASWERCAPSWKSPRFMPRWASRILLEIVSIRVERLQDISEEDAEKEGVSNTWDDALPDSKWGPAWAAADRSNPKLTTFGLRSGFAVLWESIKGKGSWDENPYVWVIEFKVVEL